LLLADAVVALDDVTEVAGVHHQRLALRALRDDAHEPQVLVAVVRRDELLGPRAGLVEVRLRLRGLAEAGLRQQERHERIARLLGDEVALLELVADALAFRARLAVIAALALDAREQAVEAGIARHGA